jgi:hypothetical protein
MKMLKVMAAAAIVFSLNACKKKDTAGSADITTLVQDGSWKVTEMRDSGTDKTSKFSDYTFTFSNGTVTGNKSGSTITGTYAHQMDDSHHELVLTFTSSSSFSELSDDWEILEQSSTKIRLQDDSGSGSTNDLLTFEKK